jgi:recombination protein RecA
MSDMVQCTFAGCDWEGKTKGALTQHINREHAEANDPLAKLRASIPGSPRPGAAIESRPLVAAPSGVPSIDYAIGIGGVPRGALVEVFGPSQTGKTFVALTFSAYAQSQGEKAGYMDAERAMQKTFLQLVPGLDADALEYGMPPEGEPKNGWDGSGESALEASRRFIKTGGYGIWTVDSVHALTPRAKLDLPIGHPAAAAAIARLMSEACPILEYDVSRTNTTLVFVNHVKEKPGQSFGRQWSKPGGSALDYYCAIQLHVTQGQPWYRKGGDGRKLGHTVKVSVHKSKVGPPHARAEFDLFYAEGVVKGIPDKGVPDRYVTPGIDVASSWFSILNEEGAIRASGGRYVDEHGEVLGNRAEAIDALRDPNSQLRQRGQEIVYPKAYQKVA